jgi:hypothetical protein
VRQFAVEQSAFTRAALQHAKFGEGLFFFELRRCR